MGQSSMRFTKEIIRKIDLDYLIYVPKDYYDNDKIKWPLIIFLHGAGERGNDLEAVKINGIPKIVETSEYDNFPFIVISPQCPHNSYWSAIIDELYELLTYIKDNYSIDSQKIYLTGLSMGGNGTLEFAVDYPDEFAAIAPICGWLDDLNSVRRIKDIPIWLFHGAKDQIVPAQESQNIADAIREHGGNIKFTLYPEAEHDSWTESYENPELYKWFLEQKKS